VIDAVEFMPFFALKPHFFVSFSMSHDGICGCSGDEEVVASSSCRCSCLMHGQEKLLDK
jgi:hypothetical protein